MKNKEVSGKIEYTFKEDSMINKTFQTHENFYKNCRLFS